MKSKLLLFIGLGLVIIGFVAYTKRDLIPVQIPLTQELEIGDCVDSLNGVYVYYNGSIDHVLERNTAPDGYNLGLKYQCVEFVKRYYYEHLDHKMPDTYGHAKDFYNLSLSDGQKNVERNLIQYSNPSKSEPMADDLLVFGGGSYGHVAIVSKVLENEIEVVQQNPGPYAESRIYFDINQKDGLWHIESSRILGWLRKE